MKINHLTCKLLYFLIFLGITVVSCDEDDPGPVITMTHDTGPFAAVELQTASNVEIIHDFIWKVDVEGHERDVEDTDVFIENSTLIIRENGNIDDDQRIRIHSPYIFSVKSFGSSDVTGELTFFSAIPLNISSFGSGDMEMQIDSQTVNVNGFGSGDIILSGGADSIHVELTGSGWIKSFLSPVGSADILLSGSGSAEVTVIQNLTVQLTGSGNVYYKGNPHVDAQVTGSGNVINAN